MKYHTLWLAFVSFYSILKYIKDKKQISVVSGAMDGEGIDYKKAQGMYFAYGKYTISCLFGGYKTVFCQTHQIVHLKIGELYVS